MQKDITHEHASNVLKGFLPLYATAIGHPESPTAYLENVRRFNLERAEDLLAQKETNRRNASYRAHKVFAAAATEMLNKPDLLGITVRI